VLLVELPVVTDNVAMTIRRPSRAVFTVVPLLMLCVMPVLADQTVTRSRAPKSWDSETERLFESNPLEMLKGERPQVGRGDVTDPGSGGSTDGETVPRGAFAWSRLIAGSTVTDEIKAQRLEVGKYVRSPTVFRAGGNRKLRDRYSVIAVMFGIAAEHDNDVRWKDIAAAARDSFAKAAANAKAADQNTYRESKARSEDLDELVRGGSVEFEEGKKEFLWNEISERRPIMKRLELAYDKRLRPWTANDGEFKRHLADIRHEAEILAALSEVIRREEYEFYDDEQYLDFCGLLQRNATAVAQATKDKNLADAQKAVGELSKSCSKCHENFK